MISPKASSPKPHQQECGPKPYGGASTQWVPHRTMEVRPTHTTEVRSTPTTEVRPTHTTGVRPTHTMEVRLTHTQA